MPHNIKYPVTAQSFGDQWIIKDADGSFVCNTLHGNDQANAEFIAKALNAELSGAGRATFTELGLCD